MAVGVGRLHFGQLADEAGRELAVALAAAGLWFADAAVRELPAELHVGTAGQDDVTASAQLADLADAEAGVGHELEEQLPAGWDFGDDAAQLVDCHGALLGRARAGCAVAFGDGDADAGGWVVTDHAFFHCVAEQRSEDCDVLADPRLAEQPAGAARVLLFVHPTDERLDVAGLDLGQSESGAAVEVGDDPRFEHLRVEPRKPLDVRPR